MSGVYMSLCVCVYVVCVPTSREQGGGIAVDSDVNPGAERDGVFTVGRFLFKLNILIDLFAIIDTTGVQVEDC